MVSRAAGSWIGNADGHTPTLANSRATVVWVHTAPPRGVGTQRSPNARASEKDGDPSITELSDALRSQPVWEQAAGMTQHCIQLRGSEPALRQAMKVYIWKRRFRRRQTWLAWTVLLVADGALVWTDDFGFLTGAAAAATVLLATMMLGIGWARWDANIKRWRKLIAAGAEVIIEDAALSIASNISTLTTPWSQFTEVWILSQCWMLFVVPDQFQIVPLADNSSEMTTFLEQRLAEAVFKNHV